MDDFRRFLDGAIDAVQQLGTRLCDKFENATLEASQTSQTADVEILNAVERAKAFRLCLRRIWAVAANLPGREKSLPTLIPAPGMFSIPGHDRQHHEHGQCTFDFCEHSRVDYTSVAQLHEDCNEECGHLVFPLDFLHERVANAQPTAWRLDDPSLLEISRPYMAVSHVWADGTGTGIWGPGKVNKCLYRFFCNIARDFQCEGCWWDTISLPVDSEARGQALNNMQHYYADARVTLVHDLYLRKWEWIDAETACFAIVMSPWYSRGWTSLELAKSHKVKILFKARNGEYVMKDLDVDILAKLNPSSRYHAAAESIRKLRSARMKSLNDLLAILRPRDTSKPRDIPIISGLLAGVDVSRGLSQQEIYQRILRKLGNIAQGNLFHNSATMSAPGFSWCPTNILDMPVAEPNSVLLELRENGDLEGTWHVRDIDSIKLEDYIWKGTHALTRVYLESAVKGREKDNHLLLFEDEHPRDRALLVRLMRNEEESMTMLCCRFVGPVYFRSGSPWGHINGKDYVVTKVRIGSAEGMQELTEKAWQYVRMLADAKKPTSEASKAPAKKDISRARTDSFGKDDPIRSRSKNHWKALLYLENDAVTPRLFQESAKMPTTEKSPFQPSNENNITQLLKWLELWTPKNLRCKAEFPEENMALYLVPNSDGADSRAKPGAFFYGNQDMIPKIKSWISQVPEFETGRIKLLILNEDDEIEENSDDSSARQSLAGNALRVAIYNGIGIDIEPLVALLLDNNAQHAPDADGQMPLHLAVQQGMIKVAEELLTNARNAADADIMTTGWFKQSALHIAAKNGNLEIVRLLVHKSKSLDAQVTTPPGNPLITLIRVLETLDPQPAELRKLRKLEERRGQTALHLAAENGNSEIVKLLLEQGASPNVRNSRNQTPLHCAAYDGHDSIVAVLLIHTENNSGNQEVAESLHLETNGASKGNDTSTDIGVSDENSVRLNPSDQAQLNIQDIDGQTPLHLAAQKGHKRVVDVLIRYKASLCAIDKNGQTALQIAARNGYAEIVEALLLVCERRQQSELDSALLLAAKKKHFGTVIQLHHAGARSGSRDSKGMTALHYTIQAEHNESSTLLIERQEDVDIKGNKKQQSALLLAVKNGLKDAVVALLGKGADISLKDSKKRTALHWAAIGCDVEIMKLLLYHNNTFCINEKDSIGRTALHWAASRGQPHAVELLLRADAHHVIEDKDGRSALILAAMRGSIGPVQALLKNGSDPKTRGKDGKTALDWAATIGSDKVVGELLSRIQVDESKQQALEHATKAQNLLTAITIFRAIGDSVIRDSAWRDILLSAAATSQYFSAIEELLESNPDLNHKDEQGRTALMLAVENKNLQLTKKLLNLKAKVDLQDCDRRTALMIAARSANTDLIKELLARHPNLDLRDRQGRTALYHATEEGSRLAVKCLLDRGADPNIPDSRGRTALHIAAEDLVSGQESSNCLYSVLQQLGAQAGLMDKEGQTRRYSAVFDNHGERRPLRCQPIVGIDIDIGDAKYRFVPRIVAENLVLGSRRGSSNYLGDVLLQHGAQAGLKDKEGQTPLHWAVLNNRREFTERLLQHRPYVNLDIEDAEGCTPLLRAAEKGYSSLVELLLESRFRPNVKDKSGRAPLLLAAERGDLKSVTALLEKGADPNIADLQGRTPLLQAAHNGHGDIVRRLFDTNNASLNLDARDDMGRTALLLAAENGHTAIVNTLLSRNTNSTTVGYDGKKAWQKAMDKGHATVVDILLSEGDKPMHDGEAINEALLLASRKGWIALVEVLLRKDADVNFRSKEGWTALHLAAMSGHQEVVKLLLDKGISIIIKDGKERTALMQATEHGFESILSLFLDRKEVKYDIDGWMGPEALLFAAEKSYTGMVKLLLENNVNYNAVDATNRTAMVLAAANGNHDIVERLLKQKASPDCRDDNGRTALHHAAWGGYDNVVEVLLRYGADIELLDKRQQSALHLAAERASQKTVERLLEKRPNVNAKSADGQTVLHRAAWGGCFDVVMLLRRSGADPFIRDNLGMKPWQLAAEKGHEAIADALLKEEESVTDECISKQKGLIFTARKGYALITSSLLKKGAECSVKDRDGLTPLHWAVKRGYKELVRLLIDQGKAQIDVLDNQQRTPLSLGVMNGQAVVVEMLLQKGADANIPGASGQTALHDAAQNGNWEIVKALVSYKADPHARDNQRKKAWQLAAETGHHQIVRFLLEKEININPQSQNMEELFLQMVERGLVPMVKLLLEKGVNKNAKDTFGRVALCLAAENGRDDVVSLLVSIGADPGIPDLRGKTPLLWAARAGHSKMTSLLLDNIATDSGDGGPSSQPNGDKNTSPDPTVVESITGKKTEMSNHQDQKGQTTLPVAMKEDHLNIIGPTSAEIASKKAEILVNCQARPGQGALPLAREEGHMNGVDQTAAERINKRAKVVNYQDSEGRTALLVATEESHMNVVKLMLEKGRPVIDINMQDIAGRTALHVATARNNHNMVQLLIDGGADLDLRDKLERTPLLLAAECADKLVFKRLLEKTSGSVDISDLRKRTALHIASGRGDCVMIEALLANKADPNLADNLGRTPLLLAVENGHVEAVDLLLKNGARHGSPDSDGQTPLHVAIANGDKVMTETLLDLSNADDLHMKTPLGQTLLSLANISRNSKVIDLVVAKVCR
ncbi:hypothetical protein jhhlp_003772 [Lomentospora prolificans]|uniref:Uncharacterized protein n=1 Tax=Lomentospora prolificans TaxID=41688 RepID=A0A2N3N9P0_9PEZI|nr:hypothetical protein jhhlp_003772 [Lomentospora prolificans]